MLNQKLKEYAQSNIYPFHMPGHKRVRMEEWNPYDIDITEIDGFDNLHDATGLIQEAQKRAARLYGAKESFFLVNGSTCGILAAISAACPRGGKILVARNCHKAVYHGISIRQLRADYLYPAMTSSGILADITCQMVEEALKKDQSYDAVMITSPTYDGVVSDIAQIAELVHSYDIPLIVDEAHGAHFSLSDFFPRSAVEMGADVVIQSMHKTLPSMTQTALLHNCSDRVRHEELAKYLNYYETSSPSYVLMAGMERCIGLLEDKKEEMYEAYAGLLDQFYRSVYSLCMLRVVQPQEIRDEVYAFDASKILIFTEDSGLTGPQLHQILLERYQLQMEMSSVDYVLAMTSVMDTESGLRRLAYALGEIDTLLAEGKVQELLPEIEPQEISRQEGIAEEVESMYVPQQVVLTIADAEDKARATGVRELELTEAVGCTSSEFIYLYPPGIPLLVPGEQITEKNIRDMQHCSEIGLKVCNLTADGRVKVLK